MPYSNICKHEITYDTIGDITAKKITSQMKSQINEDTDDTIEEMSAEIK